MCENFKGKVHNHKKWRRENDFYIKKLNLVESGGKEEIF